MLNLQRNFVFFFLCFPSLPLIFASFFFHYQIPTVYYARRVPVLIITVFYVCISLLCCAALCCAVLWCVCMCEYFSHIELKSFMKKKKQKNFTFLLISQNVWYVIWSTFAVCCITSIRSKTQQTIRYALFKKKRKEEWKILNKRFKYSWLKNWTYDVLQGRWTTA